MSNIEFPFTDYSSGDENDTNILIAQNGNVSETGETSSSPTVQTQVTYPTQLFISETSKGGVCLLVDGYTYTKHRISQDVTQWHCIQRSVCKARLHTKGDLVICKKNVHTHEGNSYLFENYRVKAGMKRKASETQEGTHSILSSSINQLSEAAAVYMPKMDTLKRTIVRSRRKAYNVPPEPTSLAIFEIPEFYTVTDKGDSFLLYDSGIQSGDKRILIFGSDKNLEMLSTSSVWLADGTFKTVPGLFYQLYVIHALKGSQNLFKNGHLLPSLFILSPNKSEESYTKMWNQVSILCPDACPTHLIVDFEKAVINSFSKQFPHTEVKGCFFHLCQNVWRKVQQLGLATRYKQDSEFALKVRMLPSLAFATPTDIPELFNQLFMELPLETYDLALYFESTYIGRQIANSTLTIPPLFSLKMWNHHFMVRFGLPRTTNAVEAWHRSFGCHMSCHHPSMWRFLDKLKKEQSLVEVKQAFYITGRKPPKRRCYDERESSLGNLIDGYLTRPKDEFLRGVAYYFTFND